VAHGLWQRDPPVPVFPRGLLRGGIFQKIWRAPRALKVYGIYKICSLGRIQVHKKGPGVPGTILGRVLVRPQKPAQERPLNIYGFVFGQLKGLSGAQRSPQ
jgi:hypothetical protein